MEAERWGRRIRAFRKLKGYTQQGFAKQLGISVAIFGDIERGNRAPSKELLEDIASTLNVSIDEIIVEEKK